MLSFFLQQKTRIVGNEFFFFFPTPSDLGFVPTMRLTLCCNSAPT